MPIIDTADEATAREVFQRSGLKATQLLGPRGSDGEVPDEHDAYRYINRNVLENIVARVELEAQGFSGALGFPVADSTLAVAEPAWDAAQRAEYSANLLRLLREWATWLGVAAVRAGSADSSATAQANQEKMEFAYKMARDIRDVLKDELERLAAKTTTGGDAVIAEYPRSYSARVVPVF